MPRDRPRSPLLLWILFVALAGGAGDLGAETPREGMGPTAPAAVPPTKRHSRGTHVGLSLDLTALASALVDGAGEPPRAEEAPPIPITSPPVPHPELLPPEIHVLFPAFDGDVFAATLAPHATETLSAAEALAEIEPILRAIGFERDLAELGLPDDEESPLPPPDLVGLAKVLCPQSTIAIGRASAALCDFLLGRPVEPRVAAAFHQAVGMSPEVFQRALERPVYQYTFPQLVAGVPIEQSGVQAYRRQGESLSWVHGTLFQRYDVGNQARLTLDAAREKARRNLGLPDAGETGGGEGDLVLLPTGMRKLRRVGPVPALRYAYRTLLAALPPAAGEDTGGVAWMAWIDAENGKLLKLAPQTDEAGATTTSAAAQAVSAQPAVPTKSDSISLPAKRWTRDPATPQQVSPVEVDPLAVSGGNFRLRLADVFWRLDRRGDGAFDDGELDVPPVKSTKPGDAPPLDLGNPLAALCQAGSYGSDATFRQVNAYAHLYRAWRLTVDGGTIPTFPEKKIAIWTDVRTTAGNNASYDYFGTGAARLRFINGNGFEAADCPNAVNKRGNGALDATILVHELTHLTTKRLQERRPRGWCQSQDKKTPCPLPGGRSLFHDFADAFADTYADTNCFGGWTDKNQGAPDASLACRDGHHDEAGGFPRKAEAADVLDPGHPGDHFPEHRQLASGEYADGQIAAAALWRAREGLRSLSAASGAMEERVLLQRGLWAFGFSTATCKGCDRDLYRYLQDVLRQLVAVLAAPSLTQQPSRAAHEIVSGFARAGIFLAPTACIDGDAATRDSAACPNGEGGGEAVVDLDDGDPTDDLQIDGVTHPETDYLARGGAPPTFRVWTGPRYSFDPRGKASATGWRSCNVTFEVEVASGADFAGGMHSGRIATVAEPGCYGEWKPDPVAWKALIAKAGEVHYRVRTWDAAGGAEKVSTAPGSGLFTLPPAMAVVNDTGKP